MNVELISELKGHGAPIYKIEVIGGMVYSVSSDKMLASWDLRSDEPAPFSIKAESAIYTFHINKDRIFIGASSGNVNVIDRIAKTEIRNFKIHKRGVYSFAHVEEKGIFVTGGGDGFVNFFNYDTLELIITIKVSSKKIRSITYSKELQHLIISCGEGNLRIFELEYFNEVSTYRASSDSVNFVVLHPSKPIIITGGKDGYLRFWNESDESEVLSIPAHNMTIYDLKFNSNATYAVTASRDKSVKVWKAEDFNMLCKLDRKSHKGHTHSVNTIAWINNSEFLTAGDDRIIRRWKIT